jgi:hypothetical protein
LASYTAPVNVLPITLHHIVFPMMDMAWLLADVFAINNDAGRVEE